MLELKGIIPYLVSPVDAEGNVLSAELARLCADLLQDGVHGLCVFGSVGEFQYLSIEQKKQILKVVVAAAGGKVPVIAGVTGFSIAQAKEEILSFSKLGADAFVVLPSQYFPLKEDQLSSYYRDVAALVPDKPIVLYANPKYMHFDIPQNVFANLADVSNIRYYKDASGNTGSLLSLVNRFGDRFQIFSASAHIPTFVAMLGGKGWMAGPACLVPRQCVKLYDLCEAENYAEAMKLQKQLWKINRVFAKYDLVSCVKAGLNHLGYAVGDPIPPLRKLAQEEAAEVCKVIEDIRKM